MAWRIEKTKQGRDLVWDGAEFGIAPSPTHGTANLQNVNIATELGEVLASYGRMSQTPQDVQDGTLTPDGDTLFNAPAELRAGLWIQVTASTVTGIDAATNPTTVDIDYLAVAGGGGGGAAYSSGTNVGAAGGGGGAGEVATGTETFSIGTHAIVIGDGGDGGDSLDGQGDDGEDTTIGVLVTAVGGGGGGGNVEGTVTNGANGGSGGGGGADGGGTTGTGGTGTAGNDGGGGFDSTSTAGGGGGGAGASGSNGADFQGGNGGNGTSSSISGTAVMYGGGGGGGINNDGGAPVAGSGGTGGGGDGAVNGAGSNATANTGGGGGGAGNTDGNDTDGGNGGSGIVILSYTTGTIQATGGVVSYSGDQTIHTFTEDGVFEVLWINPGGYYFVSFEDDNGDIKLSDYFDPYSENPLTHGTTGTVTFNVVAVPGRAIAKATEKYTTAMSTEYRYYMLDDNGYVWVFDSAVYEYTLANFDVPTMWMLTSPILEPTENLTGMAVLNGWLMVLSNKLIFAKPTVDLGKAFAIVDNAYLNEPFPTHNNYAFVGSQGKMYYCDGNYIGEMYPTTSLVTSIANIQSYAEYTADTKDGTITAIIGGALPYSSTGVRIPAVFFTDENGTLPTAVTPQKVYFLQYDPVDETFRAYTALTGGSSIDLQTGATGNQYFNTFFPNGSDAGINGTNTLLQFTRQRVNLPFYETATSLVEVGNTVIIGCNGYVLYPWNQVDATPSDLIVLPEAGVKTMVNVNNAVYVFAGNKGNVYITNNSVASLVLKVPDYCAGVPGSPNTYIEPYFVWGDAVYLRGRVYFSILDQTADKAGNCGGVWSFIPSQNFSFGQDLGLALRLENQNSYGDYDGYCTQLIANEEQQAIAPQYWSFWQDSYDTSEANYGIDYTSTVPVTQYVVETDTLPTGTMLNKETFSQLEYKLTNPLVEGESVQLYYRLNSTDAWASCGTVKEETANRIAGYFDQAFQKTQWVQFRAVVTVLGTSESSFGRLKQIRLR